MPSPVIHLTFIDDANGRVFSESAVESAELPDSFRDDTVLHIGDDDWSVLEADPLTRAEYEATANLVLRLRRLETLDPEEMLYSLPTLCNDLPPAEGSMLDGSEVLLHSDDWRQIEFVTREQEVLIDQELDIIAQIHRDAEVDGAYQAIHLRRRIEQPLAGVHLTLDDLRRAFPGAKESRVIFETSSQCVDDSFSFFVTPQLIVYGQGGEERLEILAAAIVQHEAVTPAHLALRDLAAVHDLLLVDWCRCRKAAAADASFDAVLRASL